MLQLFFMVVVAAAVPGASGWSSSALDRRTLLNGLASAATITATAELSNEQAFAADELPVSLRSLTKLAPLGSKSRNESNEGKAVGISPTALLGRLEQSLEQGTTGKGSYIITGDLDFDIFQDNCSFVDPTNSVDSLQQYQKALTILFDPDTSTLDVIEPLRLVETGETIQITGRYRSRGTIKLPWKPVVKSFESDITYTINPSTGLIQEQRQRWSKSATQALTESFTPSFNYPPPQSKISRPDNEPSVVTKLFQKTNGRRKDDYTEEEHAEIDTLINEIAASRSPWKSELLPGKWMLVYIRPGISGGGIDRRVPFPEFEFNDNFQIFDNNSVNNIGQVLGPSVFVEVFGDLQELDPLTTQTPKQLQASIQGGKLCVGSESFCLPLPIQGTGLFDGIYVNERLRIGQNKNGGGALVVQVRVQ
jgi:hypothetical protein